jgi:tripartite-type tricarboxylate transporter receptor subunit TctC
VQMMFATIPSVIQHVRAGSLRAVAVTSSKRIPAVADIPTIAELGYPAFEASSWYGVAAPAGTPAPIVRKLSVEIDKIIKMPDINEQLSSQGAEPIGGTPESFGAYMRSETEKWAKILKASGIKLE